MDKIRLKKFLKSIDLFLIIWYNYNVINEESKIAKIKKLKKIKKCLT